MRGKTVYGEHQYDTYDVIDLIGQGAFGAVYMAKHRSSGAIYALKTLQTDLVSDAVEQRALFNEGRLAVNINHPNVVRVLYFHDGIRYPDLPPYMLMEYVAGGTLQKLIQSRRPKNFFSLAELTAIFKQLAAGMNAINQRLVHRDIKSDNILVEQNLFKIADFGLSKIADAATRNETFKGTGAVQYYAPEAWRLEKNTLTMDMYSMGIVFYEIATLNFPYTFPANGQWREVHFYQTPFDPLKFNPSLDAGIVQMILKMMSKSATERYQSWDEINQRLDIKRKNSVEVADDLTPLFHKDTAIHRKQEEEELALARRTKEQEENQNLIAYSVNQITQIVIQFINRFNEQSELSKLEFVENERFVFAIVKSGSNSGQNIHINIKTAVSLPADDLRNRFSMPQMKAWGIVTSPSGYGFNIALVAARPDDLYGQWKVMYKKLSYPNFG
ncbi:MAG: serine/threonine-protein kinase, partial [Nitrosospira sp.]